MSDEQDHDETVFGRGDFEHMGHLLNIVEKCAGHSGKLGALSNAAMAELLAMNEHVRGVMAQRKQHKAEEASYVEPEPEPEREIFTSDTPNPNLERRV